MTATRWFPVLTLTGWRLEQVRHVRPSKSSRYGYSKRVLAPAGPYASKADAQAEANRLNAAGQRAQRSPGIVPNPGASEPPNTSPAQPLNPAASPHS